MATCMLRHYRAHDVEKWRRLSRQVCDVLLPLLDACELTVSSSRDHLRHLHSLVATLARTSLKPLQLPLQIMFHIPSDLVSLFSRGFRQGSFCLSVFIIRGRTCAGR